MMETDQDLQEMFVQEAYRQALNFPGSCMSAFSSRDQGLPLLKKVHAAADAYLKRISELHDRAVNNLSHHTISRAAALVRRRMEQTFSKGMREDTLLGLIAGDPLVVIYGQTAASQMMGNLAPPIDMKGFSAQMELPRLWLIDPDGHALESMGRTHRAFDEEEKDT